MKMLRIPNSDLTVSAIALGCMRINGLNAADAASLVSTALEQGINFFDNADIYGGGDSERVFSAALKSSGAKREDVIIQSKCGICKGYFDFSKEHILQSVDGILQRLSTDYLDVLLLHRPDALMEPEEVAQAFDTLHRSGKVRYFGVSNQNPMQIELLQKYTNHKLLFNQLQLSPTNCGMIDAGLNVNMQNEAGINRDGSVLDYCRLHDITIQPWSPFQFGFFEGVFLDNDKFPQLNKTIEKLCQIYQVPNTAMVIAWLLRHPAHMQPIAGTTNAHRLADICKASKISLTRPQWYEIYRSAGKVLP